jgi:hypothetical protein
MLSLSHKGLTVEYLSRRKTKQLAWAKVITPLYWEIWLSRNRKVFDSGLYTYNCKALASRTRKEETIFINQWIEDWNVQ